MKRILSVLLVCMLLAPLLFKGLVWFQVRTQLQDAKKAFEPYGLLQWDGIYSTFDGKIGVADLAITPFLLKDTVVIESLEADFGSLEAVFKAALPMLQSKYPDALTFSLKQARVDLSETTFAALKPDNEHLASISPARIYACGSVKQLTGRELKAMGFETIEYNGILTYQFSPTDGRLDIDAFVEAENMGQASLAAEFAYSNRYVSPAQLFKALTLKSVFVQLKDLGYYRRLAFLCGRLNNLTQTEYIAAALKQWNDNLLRSGIAVDPGLIASLNEYMALGAELRLTVEPKNGLFASFQASQSADREDMLDLAEVIARLRPSYALGSDSPRLLIVQFDLSRLEPVLLGQGESARRRKVKQERQSAKTVTVIENRFVPLRISLLDQNIGKKVRVTSLQGKIYQGELTDVLANKIVVTNVIGGGSFSFPVNRESIRFVEVMKSVKVAVTPEQARNRDTF
ncbi:MAG: hypothetical protein CSA50_07755 [Gammaproteobacteria bacterium]|nr:MAG: hypothetical protein CSA50_07755 [Gammaproteobacteria bacterium]